MTERSEENTVLPTEGQKEGNAGTIFDQQSAPEEKSGQDTQASETPTYSPSAEEPSSDLLRELVGEGRKYKTIDDLAKSRLEADRFIEQLKQENHGMRDDLTRLQEDLERKAKLEDRLNSIESSQENPRNHPAVSEKEIEQMVQKSITQREQAQSAQQNLERTNQQMLERYNGDRNKAIEAVQNRASELGVSVKYLTDTAAKSPTAFHALMGTTDTQSKPQERPAPSEGTVRTEGLAATGVSGERDWSYYERLRKESPKAYWDPKVQQQLFKDAERLGDAFKR